MFIMSLRKTYEWTNLNQSHLDMTQSEIEWFYLIEAKFNFQYTSKQKREVGKALTGFLNREVEFLASYLNRLLNNSKTNEGRIAKYFYAQVAESKLIQENNLNDIFLPPEAFMILGSIEPIKLNGELEKRMKNIQESQFTSRPKIPLFEDYSQQQFKTDLNFVKKEITSTNNQSKNLLILEKIDVTAGPMHTLFKIRYGTNKIETAEKIISENN